MENLTREEYIFVRFHTHSTSLACCVLHTLRRSVLEPIVNPSHTKASSNYVNYLELLQTIFIKPARVLPA